ncbi:MAG TPA: hypothetical protein EYP58_03070 [bacterium (Candidatus Stahlbacteria)]|nr:hypothetical protein [Candidatus Stahlbacteria bacterium]
MIAEVVSNRKIATATFLMKLKTERQISADPGMFLMVGFDGMDPFLNRPFSIVDIVKSEVHIIYNLRGRGTRKLSNLASGEIVQITGPWGRAMPKPKGKTILVAGGIGVAPMLYYLKSYPSVLMLYGARDADSLIPVAGYKVTIFTEDGSAGNKGMVTDGITDDYDLVIACGPIPLLARVNAIISKAESWGIFEGRMGCGCGICLGCVLPGHGRYIRICTEGPAIPLKEVDFESLRHRV